MCGYCVLALFSFLKRDLFLKVAPGVEKTEVFKKDEIQDIGLTLGVA